MHILQINSVCGVGSTGRIATDLHAILMSRGHSSTIAFGRKRANKCQHTIRIGGRLDNYLHAVRTRLFDAHGFGSATATQALISRIEAMSPDLIHLHNLHGYYLHIGLLFEYLRNADKPVIWTLHDCWAFTGHCSHFDLVGCDRWKRECHDCPMKTKYPKCVGLDRSRWNFQQKMAILAGVRRLTIIAPSHWLSGLVGRSFLRDYPLVVIPNGIDLGVFRPVTSNFRRRHDLTDKFIILGVAAIWDERKGYACFLELAKHLQPDEKIVLVGVTNHQMKQLPPQIVGISRTDDASQLAGVYSAADVFVNPTLEDNLPTTNLESLACGTPVVTFDSGGSAECLDAGCGLVVERGDTLGLVAAIAMVKKNGKAAYTARCQQRAREQFDKDARFAEYVGLYEDSLNGRNRDSE